MVQHHRIELSSGDRARLEAVAADRNAPQKHAWRAKIVLLAADGVSVRAAAHRISRLTRRRLRRGSFASLVELQAAIHRFVAEASDAPQPFVWTAAPHGILQRVHRAQQQSASVD